MRIGPISRNTALAIGIVLVALTLVGPRLDETDRARDASVDFSVTAASPASGVASQPDFVTWQHPSGLFSTEVPRGWTVDGQLGDAMDQGQFKIEGRSPDGRSFFILAHNWLSFMEFQYGPYRRGHQTVEAFILPPFVQSSAEYTAARVVYRSPIESLAMPNPYTGMTIPFDAGTIGFLLARADGGVSAGYARAETMYIASPGTPGLWRLRMYAAMIAPAGEQAQAAGRAALERAFGSLQLSDQFFQLWNQAFDQTARQMRQYSADMSRVFSRYLESARRSDSGGAGGSDPMERWATMMRGGQYGADEQTGEQYWISNDNDYWYVNDRGDVVGNDTGTVPTDGGNWRILLPIGQQ